MKLYFINHKKPTERTKIGEYEALDELCVHAFRYCQKNNIPFLAMNFFYVQENCMIDIGVKDYCFVFEGYCEELNQRMKITIDFNKLQEDFQRGREGFIKKEGYFDEDLAQKVREYILSKNIREGMSVKNQPDEKDR